MTDSLLWRQYRLERRMFWRNPSAAFFNFLLPLLLLGLFGTILSGNQHDINILIPGIAGMSVVTTTFTALAMNMTFLRETGVLKRIRGTPLPSRTYLGGVALNAVTNTAIQITIVVVAGRLIFNTGWPRDGLELVVFTIVGVACFASLGVALAHAIPNFDSAPAFVNAIFLPVVVISGVFFDPEHFPAFLRNLAQVLPLEHLLDGLSGAMVTGRGLGDTAGSLAVLAVWAIGGGLLAVRGFSWEQSRG